MDWGIKELAKSSFIDKPRLEAEWLLKECLGWSTVDLIKNESAILSSSQVVQFQHWVKRRHSGEPFAYIVGYRDFYRSRFKVGPGVLIPRPESEQMVERAVDWVRDHILNSGKLPKIVDLGSGSGCLGLSILNEVGGHLWAVENSQLALKYLRQNILQLNLSSKVDVLEEKVQELVLDFQVDLVVANPPYIKNEEKYLGPGVKEFEPHEALFGGPTGLEETISWIPIICKILATGGYLLIEHGAGQGTSLLKELSANNKFHRQESYHDLIGWDRIVTAYKI